MNSTKLILPTRLSGFHFSWRNLFAGLMALSLSCLSVRADDPAPAASPLPPPAKYETFRSALQSVLAADKVPAAEKAQLGAWSKRIEKAFRAEWKPTVALFERSKVQLEQLAEKVEDHNAEVKGLEGEYAALDTTSSEAVAAYNARADAINARKAAYDEEKETVLQTWNERCEAMEASLDASEMASFVERSKQSLRNCYGEAYQQLLGINEGTLDWDNHK